MRLTLLSLSLCVLLPAQAITADAGEKSITVEDLKRHVEFLASDEMKGRMTGSEESRKAGDYIASQMERLGLKPRGEKKGSWFARFNWTNRIDRNVCGLLPGKSLKREIVIVGAHYDHVGLGALRGARDPARKGEVHNGADDNASGSAGLLEMMEAFSKAPTKRSILFLAFSGEEMGLVGSSKWCKKPTVPLRSAVAMVNLDMIGRSSDGYLFLGGMNTGRRLLKRVRKLTQGLQLDIEYNGGGRGPSDFQPFYLAGLPVVSFFTGEHGDYHTPDDDVDRLNLQGEAEVLKLAYRTIRDLANGPRLKFTEDDRTAMPHDSPRGTDQAYAFLGLLLAEGGAPGGGLRVKKIRNGSPAKKAYLEAGDVLVKLDGKDVTSRKEVDRYLATVRFGTAVKLVIKRGKRKKSLKLKMTLGGNRRR